MSSVVTRRSKAMRRFVLAVTFVCATLFAGIGAQAQQPSNTPSPPPAPPFGMPVTLTQAIKIADAAIAEAKKINVMYAVAISEPSGELVYFAKMEGAPYSATKLALDKAWTSSRFRRPSQFFQDQLEAGHNFFLTFGVTGAPGGLPIVYEGKLIGAIGVSGGNTPQDIQVANAGLAALK
jgi:glc operon protein GlcG